MASHGRGTTGRIGRTTALDAGELLAAVRTGELSVEEVVVARLARLHDLDDVTAAIAAFEDHRALADARALDRTRAEGRPLGPLHGLPVTVKDWIDVEGFPCAGEGGRAIGRRPSVDATVVARLRAAGAVVVAKTRSWDDGAPGGAVLHPLDASRTPGGSSSGEAVAVAAGASLLGIGSDSGGSIRLPAAWCGVLGFKPTAGRVPTTGHFPRVGALSDGRTQIGPLAPDLDTIERVLPMIAGPDGHDAGVAPVPLGAADEAGLGRRALRRARRRGRLGGDARGRGRGGDRPPPRSPARAWSGSSGRCRGWTPRSTSRAATGGDHSSTAPVWRSSCGTGTGSAAATSRRCRASTCS